MDETEVTTSTSQAADTVPQQCGSLRKGGYVVIKDRPCKIVEMTTSKTGKHGHAKAHIVALDLFTQKKVEELCPTTHTMPVPVVNRTDYQLIDIEGEYLVFLDDSNEEKRDVKIPSGEIGDQIRESFDSGKDIMVSTIKAMGEEAAVAVKTATT